MTRHLVNILVIIVGLTSLTCKKEYPENKMKGPRPPKIELMRGFITKYEVNGIDSLDLLNNYIKTYPQPYTVKIQTEEFQLADEHERTEVGSPNIRGIIRYEWNSDYDKIFIFHKNDTALIKKNIFIINGNNWDILRLVRSKKTTHHQLKIKSTIGDKTYIIQFN